MSTSAPWEHIDWDNLTHFNSTPPQVIKDCVMTLHLPGLNHPDYINATSRLFDIIRGIGYEPHTHDQVATTLPPILQCTLPLLANPNYPYLKRLLQHIHGLFDSLEGIRHGEHLRLDMAQVVISTFAALNSHLDTLARCLDHPDTGVRERTMHLMAFMYDDVPGVLPTLIERYPREPDDALQLHILTTMLTICRHLFHQRRAMPNLRDFDAWEPTLEQVRWFLSPIIEQAESGRLIDNAIACYLLIATEPVSDSFMTMLLAHLPYAAYFVLGNLMYNPAAFSDEQTLRLWKDPDLKPAFMYSLIRQAAEQRGLLKPSPSVATADTGVLYQQQFSAKFSRQYDQGRHFLHLIADCDRFWETPTNFLSLYFDLPDDRDKLRSFLKDLPDDEARRRELFGLDEP